MAMTWTSLVGASTTAGSIARWVNRRDLDANDAQAILDEAISWISARLRHWQMLSTPQTGTMTAGQDYLTVPTDLQEPNFFMIAGTVSGVFYRQEVVLKLPNDVYRSWAYDGTGTRLQAMPRIYSFNKSRYQFDAQPDLAYPYTYTYYQEIAALSGSNTTNFLTTGYPRLIRCATMMNAVEYIKEAGQGQYDRTYWAQQAANELAQAQTESDNARRGSQVDIIVDQSGAFLA